MIKNTKILEEFERQEIKREKTDYFKSLRIFESLWHEGIELGVLPLKDPLEDIETDIRIAQILNSQIKPVNPVRELRPLTVCADGGIIPPSALIR